MAKTKKTLTMSGRIQKAITDSRLTLYRVAKDTGVDYATLHRFMAGELDLRLSTAQKLAAYFKLNLS